MTEITTQEPIFILSRSSSLIKTRRIAAWVGRAIVAFKEGLRKERIRKTRQETNQLLRLHSQPTNIKIISWKPLKAHEIRLGEIMLCKDDQRVTYHIGIEEIKMGTLRKQRPIYKMEPMLHDGVIRVKGRLEKATWIPWESRHPIILSKHSELAAAIVRHEHERFYHQNSNAVVAARKLSD